MTMVTSILIAISIASIIFLISRVFSSSTSVTEKGPDFLNDKTDNKK